MQGAGDLIELDDPGDEAAAYQAANKRILEEAATYSQGDEPISRVTSGDAAFAVIVWEGASRGSEDATKQFADLAEQYGLAVEEILTT